MAAATWIERTILVSWSLAVVGACGAHSGSTPSSSEPTAGTASAAMAGSDATAAGATGSAGVGSISGGNAAGGDTDAVGGADTAGSTFGDSANGGASGSAGSVAGSGGAVITGMGGGVGACGSQPALLGLPARGDVLAALRAANAHFTEEWPDPTVAVVTDKARPSNLWTRAVYFEGLMALYGIETDATREASYYDYAVKWGAAASHPWQLAYGGTTTRDADYQCCGQTYLDLGRIADEAEREHDIKADIDKMVASTASGDWTWVDAIQMAMPVFAKLGVAYPDTGYFEKMHALYVNAKTAQGFYNTTDHLWWRDATFEPPFTTPNGKQCYWSRGNGWVLAALTRVLDITPSTEAHRSEYVADFRAMAGALQKIQRADGFWNVSLGDPNDHGGPELTGTALFAYGLAWGIRVGILDASTYGPTVSKAWCAMASAIHAGGALGFAQGSGSKPADGQPVTFDSTPDFDDFPLGCFLLGGSEIWKLAAP